MSRKSLVQVQEGRDPKLFGRNFYTLRMERGLTTRKIAMLTGVSTSTIYRIEQGYGCTLAVEAKLAKLLNLVEGQLWSDQTPETDYRLHKQRDDWWFFASTDDAQKYHERHTLVEGDDNFHPGPKEIQEDIERLRLGRTGLAAGFFRNTTSNMLQGRIASSIIELYGDVRSSYPEKTNLYLYCLRNSVKIQCGQDRHELESGDVLTCSLRQPFIMNPAQPVGLSDLPPLMLYVVIDVFGKS